MLITDSLTRAARQCSIRAPSSWVTATSMEHMEIRDDFLVDTADDILDRVDLPSPIGAQTTVTGTGVETYALPADFKRMQRDRLSVYDTLYDDGAIPVTSDGAWTELDQLGITGAQRYYRVTGYDGAFSISLQTELATGDTVIVHYVSTSWTALNGIGKASFTDPDDILLLPNRLVEAGIIWRWRERKGLPFQDKFSEYEALMARLANDSRGRRTVSLGGKKLVRWQDRVPAYIPAS